MIEMMISITVGLIIVASLVGVLASNSSRTRTNERTSEVQTNGRYALNSIKRELRLAGYRGYTWAEPNTPSTTITPISNECLETGATAGSFVSNIRQGIWGKNDSNPFSGASNCIPSANYSNGDVLVIRSLATTSASSTIKFRSNYSAGEIFRGTPATTCPAPISGYAAPFNKAPCITGTPSVDVNDYAVQINVYYISPYTTSATENPVVPALYRATLQPDGNMTQELVASGIEHFQVQYGRFTTDLNTRYFNANDITGTSTNSSETEWDDINSVRIWLLARNSTKEPGYANTQTYTMGDQSYAVNDSYRRELFSTVVQLRN